MASQPHVYFSASPIGRLGASFLVIYVAPIRIWFLHQVTSVIFVYIPSDFFLLEELYCAVIQAKSNCALLCIGEGPTPLSLMYV